MSNGNVEKGMSLREIIIAVDLNGMTYHLCTVGDAAKFLTTAAKEQRGDPGWQEAYKALERAAHEPSHVPFAVRALRVFLSGQHMLVL